MVAVDKIRPFVKQFRDLDADGSGRLNLEDVTVAQGIKEKQQTNLQAVPSPARSAVAAIQPPQSEAFQSLGSFKREMTTTITTTVFKGGTKGRVAPDLDGLEEHANAHATN